jgi:hypothetical protein
MLMQEKCNDHASISGKLINAADNHLASLKKDYYST